MSSHTQHISWRERKMKPFKVYGLIWFLDGTRYFIIGLIGGREMMPLKTSRPLLLDPVNATSCGKMDFAEGIQLRIFRWGDYSGLILWPLIRGRQREFCTERDTVWPKQRHGFRDEGRAHEARNARSTAPDAGKGRQTASPREPQECIARPHLGISPVRLTGDFWPPESEGNRLVLLSHQDPAALRSSTLTEWGDLSLHAHFSVQLWVCATQSSSCTIID